jgi:hypothetical protein
LNETEEENAKANAAIAKAASKNKGGIRGQAGE